jgi:ABC-type protease/lipase transport system fused ATPase/permease subunit
VLLLKEGAMEMFGPRAEVLKRLMTPPRPAGEAPPPPPQAAPAPAIRLEGGGVGR